MHEAHILDIIHSHLKKHLPNHRITTQEGPLTTYLLIQQARYTGHTLEIYQNTAQITHYTREAVKDRDGSVTRHWQLIRTPLTNIPLADPQLLTKIQQTLQNPTPNKPETKPCPKQASTGVNTTEVQAQNTGNAKWQKKNANTKKNTAHSTGSSHPQPEKPTSKTPSTN